MRENGGGQPAMVAYLASYLFDRRTHLNDIWERPHGEDAGVLDARQRAGAPSRQQPVYVLTSARTFSGAEEFAYDLQTQKRATIVGRDHRRRRPPVEGAGSTITS